MKQINKQPHNWSDAELKALATGEVEAGPNVDHDKLIEEAEKRFADAPAEEVLEDSQDEDSSEDSDDVSVERAPLAERPVPDTQTSPKPDPYAGVRASEGQPKATPQESYNDRQKAVFERLDFYHAKMRPSLAVRPTDGAMAQRYLLSQFKLIIKAQGSDFRQSMDALLDYVAEHRKDVFDPRYVMRFIDQGAFRNDQELGQFERLVNLFTTTCVRKTRRQTLKQVDVKKSMRGFDQESTDKMVEYYRQYQS